MRLGVVGVGLVGGSVGLAARERLGARVIGCDPRAQAAVARGALDAAGDLAAAVDGAELVVVAVPLGALAETAAAVLARAGEDTTVLDVGSTKRGVTQRCDDPRFVGGHPLAGAEAAGVEHARADLFEGATWYLTPTPGTGGTHLERAHRFVAALGARPAVLDPDAHDRAMAAVSHLPHALANVLVAEAAATLAGGRPPATGPSFRDATRVAGANPSLWADIYLANREALLGAVDGAIGRLEAVRDLLLVGDRAVLEQWQAAAREHRSALLEAGLAGGPQRELRVTVPNRPGVIADLALALADAGINIADMSLSPSEDGRQGVVALWVAADRQADARGVLARLELPVLA